MNITMYEESDVVEMTAADGDYKLEFIRDLPGDNPDLFGDHDNLSLLPRLKDRGVVGRHDKPSPESPLFYIYFRARRDARDFIKRLNDYVSEKARLVRSAEEF